MTQATSATVALDELVLVAKALGHPGRMRMLAMLRTGSLCVCQITSVLGLSSSTVSAHLSDLRRARLLNEQKRGKWVHYRLTDNATLRPLLEDALGVVEDDAQVREDASIIEALRAVPLDDLCRAGLDLTAVGVKPALTEHSSK